MRGYDYKMSKKECLFWAVLCFVIAGGIMGMQCGCDSTGTMALQAQTDQLRSDLQTAVDQVDRMQTQTGDISGELTQIKTTLTQIQNTMITIQNKITNYNGIPFWQLCVAMSGLFILYYLRESLKYGLNPIRILKGIRK